MEFYCFHLGLAHSCSQLSGSSDWRVRSPAIIVKYNTDYCHSVVEDPRLVMIVGCIGFGLNIISVVFLHGESSKHLH